MELNEVLFFFSIKYRYSDILLKKHNIHLSRLFARFCLNMVSVTSASRYISSASRYHPRYQSSGSTEFRGIGRGSSD